MKKIEPLYRGIDWLRIGYYVEGITPEDYNLFIDGLRDFLNLPYDRQYYELKGNITNYNLRVKTSANIYPYKIMLIWEDFNLSIRLAHSLKPYQIENLYQGYSPTPNILIEIPGKALRPTNLTGTQIFLKTFFDLIETIGGITHGFTFSRIDYALDLWNKETALKLLLSFESARKIQITTDKEKITLKKTIGKIKPQLQDIFENENIKHIGVGSPETRLIVYYIKTDADIPLQAIYEYLGMEYGKIYPHRIEIRFNTKHFKEERKIYLESCEPWDINTILELAFNEIKPHLTEKFKPYLNTPHPIITKEIQTLPNKVIKEGINKIVKNLTLRERSLRLISLILGSLNENITPSALISYAKLLTEKEDNKVMERLKRYKTEKEKLLRALTDLCLTSKIL